MNSGLGSQAFKTPSERLLRDVFAKVMEDWAKLIPHETERTYQTPPGGALEFKVVLSGPSRYHLVMRVPREFGLIMERIFNPGAGVSAKPEDAFAEVVSMYCGHLKEALWGGGESHPGYLPEKSTPGDWPTEKPDVSCFLRIGAFPVEIRLWDLPPAQDQ